MIRKHLRLFIHFSLFPSAANVLSVGFVFLDLFAGRLWVSLSVVVGVGGCRLLSVVVVVAVFSGVVTCFVLGSIGSRCVVK